MRISTRSAALRTAAGLTGLLVAAGGLTACGGDAGGAPDDASKDDFCGSFSKLMDIDPDASTKDAIKAVKDRLDDVKDVGTPEGIPDDAREGYETYIDQIQDIDDDASEKDLEKLFGDQDSDETKKVTAFFAYYSTTCEDAP